MLEIEFLHRVTRKAFWGLMPWRMRYTGKIYWNWREHRELSPGAQCLIHDGWLSSVLLLKRSSLIFTKPRRARIWRCSVTQHWQGIWSCCGSVHVTSLVRLSFCLHSASFISVPQYTLPRPALKPMLLPGLPRWAFVKRWLYYPGLGREGHSFKLTNLFHDTFSIQSFP